MENGGAARFPRAKINALGVRRVVSPNRPPAPPSVKSNNVLLAALARLGRRGRGRLDACRVEGSASVYGDSPGPYSMRVSILNIGRYMAMMITPTMAPTRIIMIGSMIEVSARMAASTSSS